MDWIVICSLIIKVAAAAGAFAALWWFTIWWWKSVSRKATDHVAIIESSPLALSILRVGTLLAIALLLGLCVSCAPAAAAIFPSQYDKPIRAAAEHWMPGVPWKLWKGQLYQESRLDPHARSPAGAEGLAQFMPATAREIWPLLGYGVVDRRLAEPSINAGAYYMARLRRSWSAPRPDRDRHDLAMASYNAGLGHILAAQRACGGPPLYPDIMACLPQITGRHARETLGYAPAIRRWHRMMELD